MHGNVGEWVQDCVHINYAGAPTDGRDTVTGCHVIGSAFCGGFFKGKPPTLGLAARNITGPDNRDVGNGLRLAMALFIP